MERLGDLGKEVHLALREHRLKILEISGADVQKLLALQKQTADKIAGLSEGLGVHFQKSAVGMAELHKGAVLELYKDLIALPRCTQYCPPQNQALECLCPEPELLPEDDPEEAKASILCDLSQNTCRPKLELHAGGDLVNGQISNALTFAFKGQDCVKRAGRYRITALVQANGWRWFHLSSGSCGGAPSEGHLKITATLFVSQGWDEWSTDYVLVDVGGSWPDGVHLNRKMQLLVDLDEGYDVDVKVELKIEAEIDGYGHCIVDLQEGANYFRVPVVSLCHQVPKLIAIPIEKPWWKWWGEDVKYIIPGEFIVIDPHFPWQ